jgi:hypothetical protein
MPIVMLPWQCGESEYVYVRCSVSNVSIN